MARLVKYTPTRQPSRGSYDADADSKVDLKAAEQGGTQADVDRKFDDIAQSEYDRSFSDIARREEAAGGQGDTVGRGFRKSTDKQEFKDAKRRFWTKKKARTAGVISGTTVGLAAMLASTSLGPLQFLHFGEILHGAHLSQNERLGDGRLAKMYRFLRSGGSVGSTRLGWIGNHYFPKIVQKLNNIGITPEYGALDTYKGFTIDTEHPHSPYHDLPVSEVAKLIEEETGIKPRIEGSQLRIDDASKFWLSKDKKTIRWVMGLLGDNRVATAARTRVLAKFFGFNLHPLGIKSFDQKITAQLLEGLEAKWKKYLVGKSGGPPVIVDGKTATMLDETGKAIEATDADKAAASSLVTDPEKSSSTLRALASGKTAGIAGGIAGVAGLACGLKALNETVAETRYAQMYAPLMRIGMAAISVKDQLKSGVDVDNRELDFLSKNFRTAKKIINGKEQTVGWQDNAQIRADVGETGGIDSLRENGDYDALTQSSIPWLAWTGNLGPICSTAGEVITGTVSIGLGVLTGGIISTVSGYIVGAAVSGPIMDKAASMLAGDAIPTEVGAVYADLYGAYADAGATLIGNAAAIQFGGAAMSRAESNQQFRIALDEQESDFRSRGVLARMFDPYESRSLVGRVADSLSTDGMQNLGAAFSSVIGAGGNAISLPFKLYSSTTHAAVLPEPYDYGFPIYGFTEDEQNNPLVEDPFANAEAAAKLFNSNNRNGVPDYIKKASDCFGVTITRGPQGWDAIPARDVNVYDASSYNPADCGSGGGVASAGGSGHGATLASASVQTAATSTSIDENWLRVRFFILDTGVMEGYACANFEDSKSCSNNATGSDASSTTVSSDAKVLAAQVLANSNIVLRPTAQADVEAAAAGQQVMPGAIASGGAGTLPCAERVPTDVNATLLQAMLKIAEKYKFTVQDIVSGHYCDTGRHPLGRAMDIFQVNDQDMTWSGSVAALDRQFAADVAGIMSALLPDGKFVNGRPVNMAGLGVCSQGDVPNPPANINYFVDACDELHVDVGVAP